jgi:hypothetical protein
MATFSLTQGADKYDFDTTGPVNKNGQTVGNWATSKDNKLTVSDKNGNALVSFDVTWQFNADNQLTLSSGGNVAFNFNTVAGVRPLLTTNNAVLNVRPDRNNTFNFDLRGEWDITADHDLSITINGVQSVIDGFIQDPRSRFMYHFFNKQNLTQETILGFVGSWQQRVDASGTPVLDFQYKREDGSTDTFSLPQGVTINRTINQFMYQYNKAGHSFRVQFVGLLQVSEDFQITYSIDRQVSQTGQEQVAATTFTIGTVFKKNNFSGTLDLAVTKADGTPGAFTLSISGSFTAVLGQTKLQAGFTFSQVRAGNTITTAIGFSGSLQLKNGQVQWQFAKNAQTMTIAISAADIKIGPARIDARLNIVGAGGQLVGVQMLFGVAF